MQPCPFARIITFGPLELWGRVEAGGEDSGIQYAPLTTGRLNGRGATAGFALLKILLCQPQRHAPRDLLLELLWPELAHRRAGARLDDAASVLRALLRPVSGENPLEYRHSNRDSGNSYHLAPFPLIWVDADAFEWHVAQACRLQRFGEEALPLWEAAHRLASRGAFLADELYSEWAKERRALLAGHYRQCVHELARLYRSRGAPADAERILRDYLVREPLDEDALRPFMELLGEQERCSEALDASQHTQEALAQEGRAPDERTQDMAEYLRAKKITRPRTSTALSIASLEPGTIISRTHSSSAIPVSAHPLLQMGQAISDREMLRVLFALEERQDMSLLSRRQLLELGIATFITRLARLDSKHISAVEREELGRVLGQSIADGWKLFLTTSNAEVLAVSQLQLALVHQAHSFLYPSIRSYLYTGAYGSVGLALHHQDRHEEALHAYHYAYLAAIATADPWYIAQNLICQADTYLALGRYAEAVHVLEEALGGLGDVDKEHRRAKAHLLGCWADVAITMRDFETARQKLDAVTVFLDQNNSHEEFDRSSWYGLNGKYAYFTGDYPTTVQWCEQALSELPEQWILRQTLVLMPLIATYATIRDRDASLITVEKAAQIVPVLNAPLMNKSVIDALLGLLLVFPHDVKVKTAVSDLLQNIHFNSQGNSQQGRG